MPIKKSAIILMILAFGFASLLVFSSAKTLPVQVSQPANSPVLKCTTRAIDKAYSPWEILTQMIFHYAA